MKLQYHTISKKLCSDTKKIEIHVLKSCVSFRCKKIVTNINEMITSAVAEKSSQTKRTCNCK